MRLLRRRVYNYENSYYTAMVINAHFPLKIQYFFKKISYKKPRAFACGLF